MQRRPARALGVLATASLLALWPAPARGYFGTAEDILEALAEARAGLSAKSFVASGYLIEAGTPRVHTELLVGRGLFTEIRRSEGTETELTLGQQRFRSGGGAGAIAERVRADPLLELLGTSKSDPNGQRGRAMLARMRIDPQVMSLQRFDGRPVVVIGALPGDLSRPQLWIDKRFLAPVRWFVEGRAGLDEVRATGYGVATTGPWFPERVETWRGGERTRAVVYTRAQVNADVDRRRFQPPNAR